MIIRIENEKLTPLFGITEGELTKYIKDTTSPYFSAKDFRTFRANVFAYRFAKSIPKPTTKKEQKKAVNTVAEMVSVKLNNTPGVCKKSYIDPNLFIFMFGKAEQFDKPKEDDKKEFGGLLFKQGGKTPAWTRAEGKSKTGGLNQKGRDSYNKANPGSNLKPPQPEGGARKKSFCARSNGQRKMHNIDCSKTPDKRICLARRKWKCEDGCKLTFEK
jgi:hypothetical protein